MHKLQSKWSIIAFFVGVVVTAICALNIGELFLIDMTTGIFIMTATVVTYLVSGYGADKFKNHESSGPRTVSMSLNAIHWFILPFIIAMLLWVAALIIGI